MSQKISAAEKSLKKVFCDDYKFVIPPYQRPYSWTTEQTGELLDDLDAAINHGSTEVESMPPYFLGSIVLIKKPETNTHDVVDGQQRLTTLTILFSVLRSLRGEGEHLFDEYIFTPANELSGRKEGFRLSLRERDRKFFRDYIQRNNNVEGLLSRNPAELSDSEKHIYENTKYLWDKLREDSWDPGKRKLLMQFLLQQCFLIVVSALDEDSAHRIFLVMNTRGLELLPTDILKAVIIAIVPEDDQPTYTDTWEHIEGNLGRDSFRDLFAHIRMIYAKNKQRGMLNQEFKDHVLTKKGGSEFIDDVLSPYSEAYRIVSGAKNDEDFDEYLRHLNRLDNKDWMPPAIAFFHKRKGEGEELFKFARDLERLAYALFVWRANVNERIGRYAQVLKAIEEEDQDLFVDDSPLQLSVAEKETFKFRLNEPIYTVIPVRKPLLLRLDSSLTEKGAEYNHLFISIEHVLPQTPEPNSQWMKWFPEDKYEYWVHRLANLVLLSGRKNRRARNYDFDQKKEKYKEGNVTPFALTIEVLNEDTWTPEVLEKRQRRLCEILAKEWRL